MLVERAFGKPSSKKQLSVINNDMYSNFPASKMNSIFIPSKLVALLLSSFFNAQNSSVSVISVFRV